jgi:hypothetical protein
MTDERETDDDLSAAITRIYTGPLDEFISRRDALVKELRSAGRRADASDAKALRKPARFAWALNVASQNDSAAIERVADAVAATLDAQRGQGDVRAALSDLRGAVQRLADAASGAAADGGFSVDRGDLVNAVMAVIGAEGAFELLRAGRLVDIPEAGGLDFLSAATTAPRATTVKTGSGVARSQEDEASREAVRLAESAVTEARQHAATAERALRDAEFSLETAERRLRVAQEEAHARQVEHERARGALTSALAWVREAEAALAEARRTAGNDG